MKMHFVGFSPRKEQKMEEISKEKAPVYLTNCKVQQNKLDASLEIVVGDYTRISKSGKTLNMEVPEVHNAEMLVNITLGQLKEQPPYQRVSAKVTVLEIGETNQLGDGRRVQMLLLGITLALPKLPCGRTMLVQVFSQKSYDIKNMRVLYGGGSS